MSRQNVAPRDDRALVDPAERGTPASVPPYEALLRAAKPLRHYGQWIGGVVALVIVVALGVSVASNEAIDTPTIGEFLFAAPILEGLLTTLKLAITAAVLSWVIGILLAVCRLSHNRILSWLSAAYIWLFRGAPLLVQILIWGNLALLFPRVGVGIPFTNIMFFSVDTNVVFTAFVASILGLGLHEAAYMAEIVRSGIISIDAGQSEAAASVGMTSSKTMRIVVLPQALRVIVPPTGNRFIGVLKESSLVSVIAGGDLLTNAQIISSVNLKVMELLFVATFWYLVIVSVASIGQFFLERHLSKSRRL